MIPSPGEAQRRAFQHRQRALSHHANDVLDGEERPMADRRATYADTMTNSFGGGQGVGLPTNTSLHSLDGGNSTRVEDQAGDGVADDEFETFHRSFSTSRGPLEALATDSVMRSYSDANNNTEQSASISPSSDALVNSPPRSHGPETQSAHEPIEDPTVAQARMSMMARTGDRHARGKLPEPRGGAFEKASLSPIEPPLPSSRSSKRFIRLTQRSPDLIDGVAFDEDDESLDHDNHIVVCGGCNLSLVVSKSAIIVRCSSCNKVSPASSGGKSIG